ncbi:hypothetical protein [Flavobacterium sp.]|uniref:hypothetical protein n=1 Tax=Flavobacterium sp. TaxID=239 RepID=UPI002633F686|nr:hypothetical protein [Flavobacterium sp.]
MKLLKNSIVGFLVSFIGSIPLGYLNLIGFQIYLKTNMLQLVFYLFGVIIIEAIVIYRTLQFAHKLNLNLNWKKWISLFSIVFLLFLAYYFYSADSGLNENQMNTFSLLKYPTLFIGLFLSCTNFAQIPFWMSWNLYLVNGNYINNETNARWFYIIGTIIGTFLGMLTLILGIDSISNSGLIHQNTIVKIIPLLFIGLAVFQVFQLIQNKKPQ